MRLTLALLPFCLALCGACLAQEQQAEPMTDYSGYMNFCINEIDVELMESGKTISRNASALILVQCQCEFEKMPAQGQPVNDDTIDAAVDACEVELESLGLDSYAKKYGQRVRLDQLRLE